MALVRRRKRINGVLDAHKMATTMALPPVTSVRSSDDSLCSAHCGIAATLATQIRWLPARPESVFLERAPALLLLLKFQQLMRSMMLRIHRQPRISEVLPGLRMVMAMVGLHAIQALLSSSSGFTG